MNDNDTLIRLDDPFEVLGVDHSATEPAIRKRYLELIKLHPPERDPERFREIHEAYEFAKNPLRLAKRLLQPSSDCPKFSAVVEAQTKRPPTLSASLIVALGNRPAEIRVVEDEVSSESQLSEGQPKQ